MKRLHVTLALLAVLSGSVFTTYTDRASAAEYQFKVGDHVDVDRTMSSGPTPESAWKGGTIRKCADGGYYVELDEYPGGPDNWVLIPARAGKWTRASQTAAPANQQHNAGAQGNAQNANLALTGGAGGGGGLLAVGQRVDFDPSMSSSGTPDARWKSGVIKKIADGGYWVEVDGMPGSQNWSIIPINNNKWTRPSRNTAAPQTAFNGGAPAVTPHAAPQPTPLPQQPHQGHQTPQTTTDADVKPHTGPHSPTVEHVKAMITADRSSKASSTTTT